MSRTKTRRPPQNPPIFTIDASTIVSEVERLLEQSRKVHETILVTVKPEDATFSNVILPLARNQNSISWQLPILGFYEAVSTDEELQDASTEAKQLYADFEIETNTHEGMFALIDAVMKKNEDLEAEDKRLLERYHRNFLRNGLGVTAEKRERFKEIQRQLHQLASEFEKNLREGDKGVWFELEELDGLPNDLVSSLTKSTGEHDGKVLLPFGFTHVSTVLKYAAKSETRRVYYTAYDNRCPKNVSVFKQIMVLRQESAQLLGYANHAAFRIEDKMAKTPDAVMSFLDDLHSRLSDGVRAEVNELKELKNQDLEARGEVSDGKMYLWDQPFYSRMMLEKQSSIDREQIAEFFPLETTVTGVLDIFSHLFGLVFKEIVGEDRDALSSTSQGGDLVWQEDVQMYAVWDDEKEGGSFVGYLYLDLYPRVGKYGGMCNMNLQCGFQQEDGSRHYPATALICNLSKPTATKPSLLTHDQVLLFTSCSSRVYAADMFYSVFKDDPMDSVQGRRYRRLMLEKGASVDEMTTLVGFLGRQPSAEAFYKDLGLQ
ncbi:zincin, partial [Aureobasidium melanogenum]